MELWIEKQEIVLRRVAGFWKQVVRFASMVLRVTKRAFKTFADARGAEAAASMAYYAFFSLFPLLLFLVALSGFVLQNVNVYQLVVRFFADILPTFEDFVAQAIAQVIALRGPVTAIGVVALLWSSSAFFVVLTRNVERAWPHGKRRNYLQQRVTAFKMVAVMTVLLLLFLMANTVANIFPRLLAMLPLNENWKTGFFWNLLPRLLAWFITYAIFVLLYRWTPSAHVSLKSVSTGAWFASLIWQMAAGGFAWFLRSGVLNYQLVYGSLGTIAALMFWFYISGWILLYGAHLSASVEHELKKPRHSDVVEEETW